MKLNILLSLIIFFMLCGCQMINQNLNEMTETDYSRVEREVYLLTKISCREFFKAKPDLKVAVVVAMDSFGSDIGKYVEEGTFLNKLVEVIDDPEMKELAELILLEVGKYGGFKYVDQAQELLDARSAGLLKQIVFAIADAAGE